jgi:hypothetical protein
LFVVEISGVDIGVVSNVCVLAPDDVDIVRVGVESGDDATSTYVESSQKLRANSSSAMCLMTFCFSDSSSSNVSIGHPNTNGAISRTRTPQITEDMDMDSNFPISYTYGYFTHNCSFTCKYWPRETYMLVSVDTSALKFEPFRIKIFRMSPHVFVEYPRKPKSIVGINRIIYKDVNVGVKLKKNYLLAALQ